MPELNGATADTIDLTNDYLWFNDVSPTPDEINAITGLNLLGQNLADIRALTDPGADRLIFWDDSAGAYVHLTLGTNLSITGTTLNATGGSGVGGGTGSTDNAILRADGTGGSTAQASSILIDDSGNIIGVTAIGGNSNLGLWIGSSGALIEEEIRLDGATGNVIFNGTRQIVIGSSGVASPDVGIKRAAAGIIKVTDASTGAGAWEFAEMTAPAAPAANGVRFYAEDNGSGKTRLMAIFSSGAAQQVAIQP
jgi:hypothetical protein